MIWIVCGAGRGVGKTTLCGALGAVLPRAVHVKHGHGPARPERATPLLHDAGAVRALLAAPPDADHLLVESNTLALEGGGDLVVYVDGAPDHPDRRPDADRLRARADLVIARDVPDEAWVAILERALPDSRLRPGVLAALSAQRAHLIARSLRTRAKIWFEIEGRHGLGVGLTTLLPAVRAEGTLRKGAAAAGMSYRYAWDLVRTAEGTLGMRLLAAQAGGRGGGSSTLTADAERLVDLLLALQGEVEALVARRFEDLLHGRS